MKKIVFFLVLFLSFSCQKEEIPQISFYYWKTIFNLSESEKSTLIANQVSRIYVRYFDIDLTSKTRQPFPKSPIQFQQETTGFEIIPVIYLKNKVLLEPKIDLDDLVLKTISFINQIDEKNKILINEIQIDCDWTLTSKDNFLNFIEKIKKASRKKISATIRLHQIKHFTQTGIPNVDEGVLMYYNMGKIANDSSNSIYDKKIADRYLQSIKKYPLKLNLALPIYSWAVHIQNDKVVGLISKIDIEELKKDANFVEVNKNYFKTLKSNFKSGIFYEKNDVLKFETISEADLYEMADDLKESFNKSPQEIIFYDLDEFNTKQYEKDIFKQVTTRF